jgi:hypothetical protein
MARPDETAVDRLRLTFELFEFGVEMKAAQLRRQHPEASAQRIEELLEAWLAEPPQTADELRALQEDADSSVESPAPPPR